MTTTTKEHDICRAGEPPELASEDADVNRGFRQAFRRRLALALREAILAELQRMEPWPEQEIALTEEQFHMPEGETLSWPRPLLCLRGSRAPACAHQRG